MTSKASSWARRAIAGIAATVALAAAAPASADLSDLGPTTPVGFTQPLFATTGVLTFSSAGIAELNYSVNDMPFGFSTALRLVTVSPTTANFQLDYDYGFNCYLGCTPALLQAFATPPFPTSYLSNTPSTEHIFGFSSTHLRNGGGGTGADTWRALWWGSLESVKISITGTPNSTSDYYLALGTIPEPTTWAMMLAGFGAVGAAMRRKIRLAVKPA